MMTLTRRPILGWVVLEGMVTNVKVVHIVPIVGDISGGYLAHPSLSDARVVGVLPAVPGTTLVCSSPHHALAPTFVEHSGEPRRDDAAISEVYATWERRMSQQSPMAPLASRQTVLPRAQTVVSTPQTESSDDLWAKLKAYMS